VLILTRRKDEVVRISGRIRIQVLGFKGNQVRLGIDAPPEVVVDREEIHLRKQTVGHSADSRRRDGQP
jgi:carbon storage regulator